MPTAHLPSNLIISYALFTMITVIAATNNTNSHTRIVAQLYFDELKRHTTDILFFSLEEMDGLTLHDCMYESTHPRIKELQEKYFATSQKFLFVIPEYNGSFPGILKLLIDAMEVKKYVYGKKAGIVGVATGRAGNLRGIDHLASIMHHMNVSVLPRVLPMSLIQKELDAQKQLINARTIDVFKKHVEEFWRF